MQKKQTVAALASLMIVSGLSGAAMAQNYGQTVVVGGEASQNNVDADYEVLEMLGPPRGAPRQQQQYAPAQPGPYYQGYQPQAVQQYPLQPQPQYGQQPYARPYGNQAPQAYQPAPQPYQAPAAAAPYSYQAPAGAPSGVNVQAPTQVFQQDPGSYSAVTVVGSPDMEEKARRTGQVVMSDGTSQLLGSLRAKVDADKLNKRTMPSTRNQSQVAPLPGSADIAPPPPQNTRPQQMAMAPSSAPAPMMDAARPYGMSDALFRQAISPPSTNKAFAAIVFPPESIAVTTTAQGKIAEAVKKVTDQGGRVQVVAEAPALAMNDNAALSVAMRRAMVIRNVLLNSGVPENQVEIRAYLKQVQSPEQLQDKKQHRVSMIRI